MKRGEILAPPALPSTSGCTRGQRGALASRAGVSASLVQTRISLMLDTAQAGDQHRPSLAAVHVSMWASRPGVEECTRENAVPYHCYRPRADGMTCVPGTELAPVLEFSSLLLPPSQTSAGIQISVTAPWRAAQVSLQLSIANCHGHFPRGTKETSWTPKQTLLDFFQAIVPTPWDTDVER